MNKLLKKINKETIKIISDYPANLLQLFNLTEVFKKQCKLDMKKKRTKRMNMIQKKNDKTRNIETI